MQEGSERGRRAREESLRHAGRASWRAAAARQIFLGSGAVWRGGWRASMNEESVIASPRALVYMLAKSEDYTPFVKRKAAYSIGVIQETM